MKLALADSRTLRFGAFTAFYFAQGVPIGLLQIAMSAWLAGQGAGAAEIGAYIGVITLPWALKLISGPFMDRFSFPAMGRRRPWVLAAQGGLTLSLLALVLVPAPVDIATLTALGFVVMAFAAVQDVAVDGMAIDLLPEEERGRANALMAFGQVAGYSAFSALCGLLLAQFGLATAALVCASTVALIFAFIAVCRERAGERLLPWTEGAAAAAPAPPTNVFGMFKDLAQTLILPMSLALVAAEFFARASGGVFITVAPVFAVQTLGYADHIYSAWYGPLSGVAAFIGILFGPAIDRFGGKRLFAVGIIGVALTAAAFAMSQPLWGNDAFVAAMLGAHLIASQVVFVAVIALFMTICRQRIAATQFAIYMSLANLSRSAGAFLAAGVSAGLSDALNFGLVALLAALGLAFLALFDPKRHARDIGRLDAADADAPQATPLAQDEAPMANP